MGEIAMYIFGTQLQAKPGRGGAAAAKLTELRDVVSEAAGQPIRAWTVAAGAPIGSFGMSTRVEGAAGLIDLQTSLVANADYARLAAEAGELWAGPVETNLNQIVATSGDQSDPLPVITVTRATIAGGNVGDAMAWSNEVLQYVTGVTGLGGMLTTSAAGNFFEVSWIFGAESGAASDAANDSLLADPGYVGLIDRAGGLFMDGSTQRVMLVQMP